jgi:starch phosphorylase
MLSIRDGWWVEGCIEGITGWTFGEIPINGTTTDTLDSNDLYDKLENVVIPTFYDRDRFIEIMHHCISLNGSFFILNEWCNNMSQKHIFDNRGNETC